VDVDIAALEPLQAGVVPDAQPDPVRVARSAAAVGVELLSLSGSLNDQPFNRAAVSRFLPANGHSAP
jgi:hypothetical protein